MRASVSISVRTALTLLCLASGYGVALAQSDAVAHSANEGKVDEPTAPRSDDAAPDRATGPVAWGVVGIRGYVLGQQMAPNGQEFDPLFSLDTNLNLWLWRDEGLYLFSDTRFWGQKAAPGITNPSQGAFDFSKREFDLDAGLAWNYYGNLEARAFAYSFNNLNRGTSETHPSGYADGVGVEQRWYVWGSYPELGLPGFDVTRASFVSVGYYPTKDMTDLDGNAFKPGPFARAYLTVDLFTSRCYLFSDTQLTATSTLLPKLVDEDVGIAVRPFSRLENLEFRLGSENLWDPQAHEVETSLYLAVRFVF